jgi:sugar phosphate isomerase/epimerase
MERPEALGEERPLGKGTVDFPAFIAKLKEIGYRGPLSIEREGNISKEQRANDIRQAITYLRSLTENKVASAES